MIPAIQELNFPKIDGKQYATLTHATVNLADMGEKTISTQVKIDGDITPDFSQDWVVVFQGEKYIMPLRQPQGAKENTSLNSTIDLTFQHWAVYQLKRWMFFTVQPVETGTAVADKYIADVILNLGDFCNLFGQVLRHYYGDTITIDLNPDWDYKQEASPIAISHSYIWDVLIKLYELFAVRWSIEPNGDSSHYVIKVGYPAEELDHIFEYGFEGGLLKVERQVQSEDIRNMLLGRGGEKNIPKYYFKRSPDEEKWRSDPDWIEELANIYFTNLMGATFRSYIQGWKAAHISKYPGYAAVGESNAYAPWAYRKGYTDSKFDPVEYVRDDESIAKYGPLLGGLDNNEEIYPSIQGSGMDVAVDVEQILSDDVEESVESEAYGYNLGGVKATGSIRPNQTGIISKRGLSFSVPEGLYATLDALNVSADAAAYITGLYGPIRVKIQASNYELLGYELVVHDAITNAELAPVGIPAGSYYFEVKFKIRNKLSIKIKATGECAGINIKHAELNKDSWKNTFDIWVKNIWDSTKLSTETNEQYAERVWKPILGDREGGEAAVIFTTGALAISEDYEFKIPKGAWPVYDTSKSLNGEHSHWRIKLAKSDADLESTGLYVPSTQKQGKAGDKFVFIGTEMTHHYVVWAETALDNWKKDQLREKKDIKPTWVVTTDRVRLNNEGKANALIQQLRIGDSLRLADKRFIQPIEDRAYETLYLQSITYTYREPSSDDAALNPDVAIVLSNEYATTANPVATMQGEISALQRQLGSISNVEQIVRAVGDKLYLRKDGISDRSLSPTQFFSLLTSGDFRAGIVGGAGWGFYKDANGNWVLETDRVNVRQDMQVNNLVINQITARGGMIIESAASMEITQVSDSPDGYICYFDQKNGTVANLFHVDDIAMSMVFNDEWDTDNSLVKFYKRRVISIAENSVTLSKSDVNGNGVPLAGDIIVHYGNYTDKSRQFVKVRDVVEGGYERYIEGLDSVNTNGNEFYFVGRQAGMYNNRPRWYIGDERGYIEWLDGKLSIKGSLSLKSTLSDGRELGAAIDGSVKDLDVLYISHTSQTQAPALPVVNADGVITDAKGWQTTAPEWRADRYIWQTTYVRKGDGTASFSDPTCIQGAKGEQGPQGIPGKAGADGKTTYTWIRYADDANGGGMSNDPAGKKYMGLAYNKPTAAESNNPADYAWSLIKGDKGDKGDQGIPGLQGLQGEKGDQGIPGTPGTSYTPNLLKNTKAPRTEAASTDTSYIIYEFDSPLEVKAGDRFTVSVGSIDVLAGTPSEFTAFLYNTDGKTPWGSRLALTREKPYVTLTADKTITAKTMLLYVGKYGETAGNTVRYAEVMLVRGEAPAPWSPAPSEMEGKTPYFHIKYSPVQNPTAAQMTETPSDYIGTYTDYTQSDSNDPTKYTWARFKGLQGADGAQGIPGTNGADGKTSYLHIKYSNDGGSTFTPATGGLAVGETPGDYIGQYTDFTQADSTDVTKYTWSKIKGDKGVPGEKGADGTQYWTWIKYSDNPDGTGMYDTPNDLTKYIGIAVNRVTQAESGNKADYTWSRFRGDDAAPAKLVVVNADAQAFTYKDDFATLTGADKIHIKASVQGIDNPTYQWGYKFPNGPWTAYGANTGDTLQLSASWGNWGDNRSVTWRCTSGGMHDEVTIAKVSSGAKGDRGENYTGNLLLKSGEPVTSATYPTKTYRLAEAPAHGEECTITIWGELSPSGPAGYMFAAYNSGGIVSLCRLSEVADGVYSAKFRWINYYSSPDEAGAVKNPTSVHIYAMPNGHLANTIRRIKLERGHNSSPVWTPNAEDLETVSVTLTNEAHIFEGDTEKAVAGYTECGIVAYKGAEPVKASLPTSLPGLPTGMTYTRVANDSTAAKFRIDVTTAFTKRQGTLTIPVTVDGRVYDKVFSWSLSLQGKARSIAVKSYGYSNQNTGGDGYVRVDGRKVDTSRRRGINMVTLDRQTLAVVEQARFDLYTGNPGVASERTRLIDKINSLDDGVFVCLYFFDNATWTAELAAAMRKLGSLGDIRTDGGSRTFAFIGYKGLTPGYALQAQTANATPPNAEVSAYVADGMFTTSKTAVGIDRIVEEYYLSTSRETPAGGSWTTKANRPAWKEGHYWWTRSHIYYTDGTEGYTDGVCAMGEAGAPAFRLDLSEENVPVSCHADGTVAVSGNIATSKATVYRGGAADTGWGFAAQFAGCTGSINGSTGVITVNTITADKATVTVTVTKAGHADLTAVMNLWKVRPGAGYTPNLLRGSDVQKGPDKSYSFAIYAYDTIPVPGKTYTLTVCYRVGPKDEEIAAFWDNGYAYMCRMSSRTERVQSFKVVAPANISEHQNPPLLYFFHQPNDGDYDTTETCVKWAVLTEGDTPQTAWIPAASEMKGAKTVVVNADAQIISYADGYNTLLGPATVNLSATLQGTTGYQWSYKQEKRTAFTDIPGATSPTYALARDASIWGTAKSITIRCTSGGMHDEVTIAKVSSGAKGATGAAGKDSYTVLLTNESHTFAGGVSSAVAGDTTCEVIAYKGATRVPATIDSITGQVTGLTTAITNPSTTSVSSGFAVNVTTALTQKQGVLKVNLTVDGKSFTREFSWSLALKGATGDRGPAATVYQLGLSADAITRSLTGALVPASLTVTKYKVTGDSRATTTEKCVHYQALDSSGNVQSSGTVATPGSSSFTVTAAQLAGIIRQDTVSVVLTLRDTASASSAFHDSESVPVLNEGSATVEGRGNMVLNSGFRGKAHWDMASTARIDQGNGPHGQNSVYVESLGSANLTYRGIYNNYGTSKGEINPGFVIGGHKVVTVSIYTRLDEQSWADAFGSDNARMDVMAVDANGISCANSVSIPILPRNSDGSFKIGEWVRFDITVPTSRFTRYNGPTNPSGEPYAIRFYPYILKNGKIRFAAPQVEWGNTLTGWEPSPRDNDYLSQALRDALTEGNIGQFGLILATLLRMGSTGADGTYRVMSGISGLADREDAPAIWMGGDMYDAESPGTIPPGAKAASGMFRHNGQGYLSHGAIRFLEDAIQLGGDEQRIQADATGLKMLDSNGEARLTIRNDNLPAKEVDLIANEVTDINGALASKQVTVGYRNQDVGIGGLTKPGCTGISRGATWTIPLGRLAPGSLVSGTCSVSLGFNANAVPATRPFSGSFTVTVYRREAGVAKAVYSRGTSLAPPTSTSTVVSGSLAVNATTDVGADYYMDITINETADIPVYAGSRNVAPSFSGKVTKGAKQGTTIALDGLMAVMTKMKFLATANYFGVLAGNYGLQVSDSGIRLRLGSTTWKKLGLSGSNLTLT